MAEPRYPTEDEFWKRLEKREVEPDLQETLRSRAASVTGTVQRLGNEATVIAFVERILPGAAVPAAVIAQFLDEHFDDPMGRADERVGIMPRDRLFPAGFAVLDSASAVGSFASLDATAQDDILRRAEKGELKGPEGFDASVWFKRLRDLVLLGFGADPRGMVQMGYPGPAYKPGHVWLSEGEIEARTKRRIGYLEL
jgi:hypothetical protein